MTFRTKPLLSAALLPALLAGCAAKGTFPSLAPRPFELGKTSTAPAAVATSTIPVRPSDPALLARLNTLVRRTDAGIGPFNTALANARRAVAASGRTVGSEAWIAAQMAISRLERTYEPTRAALSDVDIEKRLLLMAGPSEDDAALSASATHIEAINTEQASALRALIQAVSPRR